MDRLPIRALVVGLMALYLCFSAQPAVGEPQKLTPQQLQQDYDTLLDVLADKHPDATHSASPTELRRALAKLRQGLNRPMTQNEAWQTFATLNPVFADGHFLVALPNWRGMTRQHLKENGTLFPFEAYVEPRGNVFIRSKLGGEASPLVGAEIKTINGVRAREIALHLLTLVHGDTLKMRADLLSQRWWLFYWKVYGEPKEFHLALSGRAPSADTVVPSSHELPVVLQIEDSFEREFHFELLSNHAALLSIGAFAWSDKQRFWDFTRAAFTTMHDENVTTLIIDVRYNGGGDDDMWMKGILSYIATKRYHWCSRYLARVVPGHQEKGEVIGTVESSELKEWMEPEPNNPVHFSGKVYVLVGAASYSSTILFANVMQDYGFGTLAGVGGSARTQQSGGVQTTTLPNSGLAVPWPRFILTRPSGATEPRLLTPDIPLADDPYDSRTMVNEVLRIAARTSTPAVSATR